MRKLGSAGTLILSFASVILIGSLVLMAPFSLKDRPLGYIDALFTATSAVCVTGLTVTDLPKFYDADDDADVIISAVDALATDGQYQLTFPAQTGGDTLNGVFSKSRYDFALANAVTFDAV